MRRKASAVTLMLAILLSVVAGFALLFVVVAALLVYSTKLKKSRREYAQT